MQWGHIKTLFIICFLILNIFLVQQILEKRVEGEISALESTSASRFGTLEANYEGVTDNLSEEEVTDSYLYLTPKRFEESELAVFDSIDNQEIALTDSQNMLISQFQEPVPVPVDGGNDQIEAAVKEVALLAENYRYWSYEENSNVLIFFQENNNKPIYYSESGLLLVFLNGQNEIVQYVQTEMVETDDKQVDKPLINSVDAVFYLSSLANELLIGDEITDARLGYHTLTALPDDSVQVFVPSWSIMINNDRNYLVNAVEIGSFSRDESSFLRDTLISYNSMVTMTAETDPLVEEAKERLETILESTIWSDENGN